MRGNKLGKVDFGQKFERVGRAQVRNDGVIAELKRLDGQRRVTGAVAAGVATIIIIVLVSRGTGTVVGS